MAGRVAFSPGHGLRESGYGCEPFPVLLALALAPDW